MEAHHQTLRSANALRVFEVAARSANFTLAAAELHVTPVAVSRMVSRLEDTLGIRLFTRSRLGVQLTEEGAVLHSAVSAGFAQMETALREIIRRRADRSTVTLSLSSGFISHWLMPRYARFQEAAPHINLRFEVISGVLRGDVDDVDLGLRLHDPARKWQSWAFFPEVVLPVCSPDYLHRMGAIDEPAGVRQHTLIHLTTTTMRWEEYGSRAGIDCRRPGHALGFSDSALVLQAALLGQGIALGWVSAVSGALREGLLVPAASSRPIRTGMEYRLVARPGSLREEVRRVLDWLVSEMQEDIATITRQYPVFLDI
ncbi:LysR substrate-binding domain-containing protein [Variovorax guangxiensis]|uniref:LysR substrate-binding domain-containing protein n=1 Tax=Variovorax guangxiensis TaxID=1775474 RepID=UPI00285AC61E|nr:LysR substrate-binding domain-containing protein [Variovorax guangxiensis]MDR6859242.1 DNA-binding transcriptional LysR family regulator [Variovorax guangxiensis]